MVLNSNEINPDTTEHNIGVMKERSLHALIKSWYAKPSDSLEVKIGNYVIDIICDDLLIEIQTRNFSAIREKITSLVEFNKVRLVYPISERKWVIRKNTSGKEISKRRSPKRGKLSDIFEELVSCPDLIAEQNLSLEILMIESEDVWCDDGLGSWRRKGASLIDRNLVAVNRSVIFDSPRDFLQFIPEDIEVPFTNRSLSVASGLKLHEVQRMTYCLKKMGAIKEVGKIGNALQFEICSE